MRTILSTINEYLVKLPEFLPYNNFYETAIVRYCKKNKASPQDFL